MQNKEEIVNKSFAIPGFISLTEIEWLYDFCKEHEINSVLEMGCAHGRSTSLFAQVADEVVTVDSFNNNGDIKEEYEKVSRETTEANLSEFNVKIIEGLSLHVVKEAMGEYDLLFIDGDHTPEYLYEELKAYVPMAKHIIGHDSNYTNIMNDVSKYCSRYNRGFQVIGSSYGFWRIYEKNTD